MPSTGSSAWDFDFLLPGALGKLAVMCHEAQKASAKAAFAWGHSTHGGKSRPGSGWAGPWGGGFGGFGGPGGAWWPGPPGAATKPAGPRGTKAGRGDVRAAILAVLS